MDFFGESIGLREQTATPLLTNRSTLKRRVTGVVSVAFLFLREIEETIVSCEMDSGFTLLTCHQSSHVFGKLFPTSRNNPEMLPHDTLWILQPVIGVSARLPVWIVIAKKVLGLTQLCELASKLRRIQPHVFAPICNLLHRASSPFRRSA